MALVRVFKKNKKCFFCKKENEENVLLYNNYEIPCCIECKKAKSDKICISKAKLERFIFANYSFNSKKLNHYDKIKFLNLNNKDKNMYLYYYYKKKVPNASNKWIWNEVSKTIKWINKEKHGK
jgi:hypothetical protein